MRSILTLSILLFSLLCFSCAKEAGQNPVTPFTTQVEDCSASSDHQCQTSGSFVSWGRYRLEIARDGSFCTIVPDRNAEVPWGYHLNVVKLLEVSPCTDCLSTGNVHVLANGDVSVDISIRHPYDNPVYTGFDVRGIIMFPASQNFPDDELRDKAGLEPWPNGWMFRYATYDKGDAELMNPDGWTTLWAPDCAWNDCYYVLEEGYPILDYYPGKYASGDNLGTINAFKRFYSNVNRHMFEAGKTVTRTYIIRPPAQGPVIEASYAIYAHWAEPVTIPVTAPALDFGPEANSPMPYEFWITQDSVLDPDAPSAELGPHIHWHVKTWDIDYTFWCGTVWDLLYEVSSGGALSNHPDGDPDCYYHVDFSVNGYTKIPDAFPGEWPYIFKVEIYDPNKPWWPVPLGSDFYIAKIAFGSLDGDW